MQSYVFRVIINVSVGKKYCSHSRNSMRLLIIFVKCTQFLRTYMIRELSFVSFGISWLSQGLQPT